MSVRQRLAWIGPCIAIIALFAIATLPGYGALQKNVAGQLVCAHLNSTAGVSHTTGTVDLYMSHEDSTAQVSIGAATHRANGQWCYDLSADNTNHSGVMHLLWKPSAGVTVHQSYAVNGFDSAAAYIPANLTHVNGTANTTSTALVGVTVNAIGSGVITATSIAADAIGESEIAAGAITTSEIATGAVDADAIADNAIDAGSIAAAAIGASEAPHLDASITTRLAPTTPGNTLDVSATGEAGVDWANVGGQTTVVGLTNTTISASTGVNVTQVNGVPTTATFDSIAAQVSSIGSGTGSVSNFPVSEDNTGAPIKGVTFVGDQAATTFANTLADDGVLHSIGHTTNTINLVYGFDVGAGRSGVNLVTRSNMLATGDTTTVSAYNFGTSTWDSRTTITGTAETQRTIPLLSGHTGKTGADLGKIYIRHYFAEGDAGNLAIDEAYVSAQMSGSLIGYANGEIWVDEDGTSNTLAYSDCTADNPCTWTAAKNVAAQLGLDDFNVASGTNIALDATDAIGQSFHGHGYTLQFDGQDISGSYFEGVEGLTGTATSNTAEAIIVDSHLLVLNLGEVDVVRSHMMAGITMSQDSVPYRFHDCTGITGLTLTFAGDSQTVVMSNFGGIATIAGMVSTSTIYIGGDADITFDASNDGGTAYLYGGIRYTDSTGGAVTIVRTAVPPTVDEINNEIDRRHGTGPYGQ